MKNVAEKLKASDVKVCAVIGFPLGQMETQAKVAEAEQCIKAGVHELDMVINIGFLKSGKLKEVEDDIRAVKQVCPKDVILKVIIETCLLTDDEKVAASVLCKEAGAHFVKT